LPAFVIVIVVAVAFVIVETETDGDDVCGVNSETPHFSTTVTDYRRGSGIATCLLPSSGLALQRVNHHLDIAVTMSRPTLLTPYGYSSSTCGYCSPSGHRSEGKTSLKYGRTSEMSTLPTSLAPAFRDVLFGPADMYGISGGTADVRNGQSIPSPSSFLVPRSKPSATVRLG
jgi:arginine-tRNA-protein transferase